MRGARWHAPKTTHGPSSPDRQKHRWIVGRHRLLPLRPQGAAHRSHRTVPRARPAGRVRRDRREGLSGRRSRRASSSRPASSSPCRARATSSTSALELVIDRIRRVIPGDADARLPRGGLHSVIAARRSTRCGRSSSSASRASRSRRCATLLSRDRRRSTPISSASGRRPGRCTTPTAAACSSTC